MLCASAARELCALLAPHQSGRAPHTAERAAAYMTPDTRAIRPHPRDSRYHRCDPCHYPRDPCDPCHDPPDPRDPCHDPPDPRDPCDPRPPHELTSRSRV